MKSKQTDIARLFHVHSSYVRSRTADESMDPEKKPLSFRVLPDAKRTALPGADFSIDTSLGAALSARRTVREFALQTMPLETLGRLLWASCGMRVERAADGEWISRRPSPSAGARYPLEVYVATQAVEGLDDGIYHYAARAHELELVSSGVAHHSIAEMAVGQDMIKDANLVVIVTIVPERTTWKYGPRGYRFALLDVGHLGQNLYLVATALGLGPMGIGGFFDAELNSLLELPAGEESLYVVCIGQPSVAPGAAL